MALSFEKIGELVAASVVTYFALAAGVIFVAAPANHAKANEADVAPAVLVGSVRNHVEHIKSSSDDVESQKKAITRATLFANRLSERTNSLVMIVYGGDKTTEAALEPIMRHLSESGIATNIVFSNDLDENARDYNVFFSAFGKEHEFSLRLSNPTAENFSQYAKLVGEEAVKAYRDIINRKNSSGEEAKPNPNSR